MSGQWWLVCWDRNDPTSTTRATWIRDSRSWWSWFLGALRLGNGQPSLEWKVEWRRWRRPGDRVVK